MDGKGRGAAPTETGGARTAFASGAASDVPVQRPASIARALQLRRQSGHLPIQPVKQEGGRGPTPSRPVLQSQVHDAGRQQGDAEDFAIDRPVTMPADAGPGRVLIDQGLNEVAAVQADALRETGQQAVQEVRPGGGDLKPAPVDVITPAKGGDAPEGLAGCSPAGTD